MAIVCIAQKNDKDTFDITVAVTGLASIVSAIISLPNIIATHLFPESGEKSEFELVKQMQEFDKRIVDGEITSGRNNDLE